MVRKLKIPAIQYIQNKKKLYSMVVDGKTYLKLPLLLVYPAISTSFLDIKGLRLLIILLKSVNI